jgi:teichuronic acid biosynthesis glycosyltransferase TuaC
MRVCVVAEFYPSDRDPVLGVWAHRQALAARDAGAEVEVVVLHRLVPPAASLRDGSWRRELAARVRERHATERDGLRVAYVPFVSPPRARHYARWGAWAAPALALALRRRRFDVVHAHNAVPVADAVRRARVRAPLVLSVHGGDVLYTAHRVPGGARAVRAGLGAARLTLANSGGIARLAREHGAGETRVVHLGADVPRGIAVPDDPRSVTTVGHLVARKRHADVLRAIACLRGGARYVVVGDGPERPALEALARDLGVEARFLGQLEHADALAAARRCAVFAMPSVDEAFGVAYVEAMAAGMPAIGATGEPGPEEIGDGLLLVPPGDVEALADALGELLDHPGWRAELGRRARATVERGFTWERCGSATVAAYEEALP